MRVESAVHRHLQQPGTIFGVPPLFFTLIVVGLLVGALFFQVLAGDAVAFSLALFGLPLAPGAAVYWRRKEPHCETSRSQHHDLYRVVKEHLLQMIFIRN
ncbi:hypothetical protein PUV47_16460 [Pseudovibrio exalbescens]|uniref:hypothetical protein n=1 Tax=Pseudovibrio exalbescens TaxID=197461 RepID=UPI0023663A06|nr:hypothetical protein [Pseudovibrio exalbescens]MDD7911525.1 hypothetical protein [Pseudovibrio exalbescens]